jgi:dipeptidyl aminopeptidase/acylaminoacyl peptidase
MISGGSAGGYTTLCALTPPGEKIFTAGASYCGVSDLEALAHDTDKIDSAACERKTLIGGAALGL